MQRSFTSISISLTSTGKTWKKQILRELISRETTPRKSLQLTQRSMRRYSARMAISLLARATWGLQLSPIISTRITCLSLQNSGWFITHLPGGTTSSEMWKTHQMLSKLTSAKSIPKKVLLSNTTILSHLILERLITLLIKTIRGNACPKTIYSEVTIDAAVKKFNSCSVIRDQEWWIPSHLSLRTPSSK